MLYRRIFVFAHRFARSSSSLANSSSSKWNKSYFSNKSKKVKVAFPPKFEEKLKSWPKLLDCEVKAEIKQLNELVEKGSYDEILRRGLGVTGLQLIGERMDPFPGRLAELTLPLIDRDSKQRLNKLLKPGVPVDLCVGEKFKFVAQAIVSQLDGMIITCKLRYSATPVKLNKDTEYSLRASKASGVRQTLIEYISALQKDRQMQNAPGMRLIEYAFRAVQMPAVYHDRNVSIVTELDTSQIRAVNAAVNKNRPFVCIQGPPGTGKTKVICEILLQLVRNKQKVLVCAPSHVAVDNALSRITKETVHSFRIRVDFEDSIISELENHSKHKHLIGIYDRLYVLEGTDMRNEKQKLLKEAAWLKREMISEFLSNKSVLFCTSSSATVFKILKYAWQPDVVIIDEAAQCTEPSSWMPIMSGARCILAGDPQQLPAIVLSEEAKLARLDMSLMERLGTEFGNFNFNFLLETQYRMNEKIMRWSSDKLYGSKLMAADIVKDIALSDISNIPQDSIFNCPLIHFDTDGIDSIDEKENHSFINIGEANVLCDYIEKLIAAGIQETNIGVISPYFAQAQLLEARLGFYGVTVNTVDAFQGQEKEVIVFSMVRENENNLLGFVADQRRMNVAVTRAKRQFVLFGSSTMMNDSEVLSSLRETIQINGEFLRAEVLKKVQRFQENVPEHLVAQLRSTHEINKRRHIFKKMAL